MVMTRSSALALLLAVGSAAAFRAPSTRARPPSALARAPRAARGPAPRRAAVLAFGGDDKFLEASMDADGLGGKLGTPLGKAALQGVAAVTAAVGWALAPSVRPWVKGVFAASAAAGGLAARRKLLGVRREAAGAVLARLLSQKGVSNVGMAEAWDLAQAYGVSQEEEFSALLGGLLGTYLEACIRSPAAKMSELSDLLSLRRTFKLGFEVAGEAVVGVASRFFSEQRAYFQGEEEHESKGRLDKLVFLADRLLCEDPSEEGFRYERTRLQKKLGLDDKGWHARVERVGAPFYRELLANVGKDPKAVSTQDIAAVGKQLGLSDVATGAMKLEELRRAVGAAIDASGGKFTSSQLEKIRALVCSVGLSEGQYREVVEAAVGPLYSAAAQDGMAELEAAADGGAAQLLAKLRARQQELDISAPSASTLEVAAARQRAGRLTQGALTHLRAQNTGSASEALGKLVGFGTKLAQLARAAGQAAEGASDAAVLQAYLDPSGARGVSESDGSQLFRVYALQAMQGGSLEPAAKARLEVLRALLGLSEGVAARVFEESAAPVYTARLAEATAEGAPPPLDGLAAELAALAAQLGLSEASAKGARLGAYTARLASCAGGGQIPSEEAAEALEGVRAALGLSDEDVEGSHLQTCAQTYRSGVQEVMGAGGVISEECWDGLGTLRQRLRLGEEAAEEIYLGEARGQLLTRAAKAFGAMREASKKEAEQGREGGDRAKLNEETQAVIVGEGVGILEFCEAAKLMVALPGGEGPICKVSLRGATEQNGLIDFYRAFLSEAFRTEGPVAEARAEQAAALAQVLGLSADEIASAQQGLGAQLCRGAILRALTDKGQLDDADRAFLQGVQGALGMDEALCDKLLLEMKAARVNSLVERMFEASDLTAAKVAAVRASCESLGLELGGSEVGLPQARLLRMLRAEVEACVERGEAPVEDTSRLAELQEAYSLPQAVAAREIEDLLAKRCGGHLLQAASALRRGNAAQVLHETEQLLRFNALNPFAVPSQAVQPNERAELLMRYQSSCLKDGPLDEEARKRIDQLKAALGLNDAALAEAAAAADAPSAPSAPTTNVL